MDVNDVLQVVNSEKAAALCLSKGGWEGWLQCELWAHLSVVRGLTVEREVCYPGKARRCDLVVGSGVPRVWVEIKAYGIFRSGDEQVFLDSIAQDVDKLQDKPNTDHALALVVVPRADSDGVLGALRNRGWNGFVRTDGTYATVLSLTFQ